MNNNKPIKVFLSYSHADSVWLKRLRAHLKPIQRDYDIDVWDDTRLKPGSKWKDEIRQAVINANVAILIISADFLASDFINTNELPPLLKAAEEEGTTILPIIASPSLFNRYPEISQFQSVNDPSNPLVSLSNGDQEKVFLRVAETILDKLAARKNKGTVIDYKHSFQEREDFLEHLTWTQLVKIGDWIFDEEAKRILGSGKQAYLLSRREYGHRLVSIVSELSFSNFREHLQHPVNKMNAGIIFGWNSDKANPRYYNLMLTGEELLLERIGFKGGDVFRDYEHITKGVLLPIEEGIHYKFIIKIGKTIEAFLDNRKLLSMKRPTGVVGRVGLRPWRSQLECMKFTVEETD